MSEKSKSRLSRPLGNPANPAGFPLIPQPRRLREENRAFPFLRKGDTSNVVSMGTFRMLVDTHAGPTPTRPTRVRRH
jgi:hypothetical protein